MESGKIVVPEFIVDAAMKDDLIVAAFYGKAVSITRPSVVEIARRICTAISENPIVPGFEWCEKQNRVLDASQFNSFTAALCAEWQRRMFLAPEPEIPEEIKILLASTLGEKPHSVSSEWANRQILEAYRRGQEAGKS